MFTKGSAWWKRNNDINMFLQKNRSRSSSSWLSMLSSRVIRSVFPRCAYMYTFLQGDRIVIKLMVPSQRQDREFKDTPAPAQHNRLEWQTCRIHWGCFLWKVARTNGQGSFRVQEYLLTRWLQLMWRREGRFEAMLTKSQAVLRRPVWHRRLNLGGWFGPRLHVPVVAKYNEVAKLPWQRSWWFQQICPDVLPRGLVSMKGDSRVRADLFHDPDAGQHITHRRSKTQLVLAKSHFSVIRTLTSVEQTQVWGCGPAWSRLGCAFAWVCTKSESADQRL